MKLTDGFAVRAMVASCTWCVTVPALETIDALVALVDCRAVLLTEAVCSACD